LNGHKKIFVTKACLVLLMTQFYKKGNNYFDYGFKIMDYGLCSISFKL